MPGVAIDGNYNADRLLMIYGMLVVKRQSVFANFKIGTSVNTGEKSELLSRPGGGAELLRSAAMSARPLIGTFFRTIKRENEHVSTGKQPRPHGQLTYG